MLVPWRSGLMENPVVRGVVKALTVVASWYLLHFIFLGVHEAWHAMVATMLGATGHSVFYFWLWVWHIPLPWEGACAVMWPTAPTTLQSFLTGGAGGWGTFVTITLLDRAVKPHGLWSRYVDYASNVHSGTHLLYGCVEALWAAGLVADWFLSLGFAAGFILGVFLALLEANGVINV